MDKLMGANNKKYRHFNRHHKKHVDVPPQTLQQSPLSIARLHPTDVSVQSKISFHRQPQGQDVNKFTRFTPTAPTYVNQPARLTSVRKNVKAHHKQTTTPVITHHQPKYVDDHHNSVATELSTWAYSLQDHNHTVPGNVKSVKVGTPTIPVALLGHIQPFPDIYPDSRLHVADLLNKLGIMPNNISFFEEALTHTTYTNEHPQSHSYQRLEFLGDAIIGFMTARFLYEMSSDNEGAMTRDRISIVQAKTLTRAAIELELGKYIRVGAGLRTQAVTPKMLEDCFEAFIGALYLDQPENVVKALLTKTIFRYFLNNDLQNTVDYKTRLQQYVKDAGGAAQAINYLQEKHNRKAGHFYVSVTYANRPLAAGYGSQLREAEIDAAKNACQTLETLTPQKRRAWLFRNE